MLNMSGYIKTFKVDNKNNNLMTFHIDDERLLQKYKAIWTKIEDSKNIKLTTLPVYDDRCIKTKIRTYDDKLILYLNIKQILLASLFRQLYL